MAAKLQPELQKLLYRIQAALPERERTEACVAEAGKFARSGSA